jgi:hypothetical protein
MDAHGAAARDIDQLTMALLDLEGALETALRTALSVHRLLERIRQCGDTSGERTLLIQEMARKVLTLRDGAPPIERHLNDATRQIGALQPVVS